MERGNFMGSNGGGEGGIVVEMKLPIGFRFRPTDEELVVHYLRRKALSLPLPASVILDFDVFFSDPWSLPGDLREKRRYYFCSGKGVGSKCKNVTATSFGFWKTNGKGKQIVASSCDGCDQVVGIRKLWAFYQKNTETSPHGWARTPWVMHEFQLPRSTQNPDGQKQEWVVCRVFQRKKPYKQGFVASEALNLPRCRKLGGFETPSYIDFKLEENSSDLGPPEPSSPCCSSEMVVSNSSSSSSSSSAKELA